MNRLLLGVVLGALGCGGSSSAIASDATEGAEDDPCYPNKTCNAGLSCEAARCTAASAVDTGSDTTPTVDTTAGAEDTNPSAVGLENLTGTVAVQHSFNTAGAVANGSALRFTP